MKAQVLSSGHLIGKVGKTQFSILNWLSSENAFFTALMEEHVTNLQFALIFNVMISFMVLVGCSFISVIPLLFSLVYFILSLRICRKGGLK